MFSRLTIDDLYERSVKVFRPAHNTRPAIFLAKIENKEIIIKDFSRNRSLFAHSIGRLLIWREAKAYRRLQGIEGIPRFYGTFQGLAIALEYVNAPTLKDEGKRRKLGSKFFERLKQMIKLVHQRGVAHCDLKKAPNILVSKADEPFLIDWGASISKEEFRLYPLKLVYERFLLDDWLALTKMKLKFAPELVSPEERERYERRTVVEKAIRKIRDRLRELLQKLV